MQTRPHPQPLILTLPRHPDKIERLQHDIHTALRADEVTGVVGHRSSPLSEEPKNAIPDAVEYVRETTNSLFGLVPAIRMLRQQKALHDENMDRIQHVNVYRCYDRAVGVYFEEVRWP